MPDYSKSKIYKIVANTDEEYRPYIGSTIKQYLSQRFAIHKSNYLNYKNGKTNFTSSYTLFDKYGIENCEIILIENYPCATKDELIARERYWFDTIENCNKNKPKNTQDELDDAGKIIYQKQLQKNPNHNKQKYLKQLALNPNLCKQIYQRKLELHPDANKKMYQRKLELHPNLKEKLKEKYTCDCGSVLTISNKSTHNKSKKHLTYIGNIIQNDMNK
jgi:hypothetical protein